MRALTDACKGIARKPGRTFLSVMGITVALVMFGVLGSITFCAHGFMEKLRKSEEITIYILDSLPDADMLALDALISKAPEVESTRIVTKENAAREFEQLFGKNLLSSIEENPLPRSIVVTMAKGHRTAMDFQRLASRTETMTGVESVEYGREWMSRMDTFFFVFFIGEMLLVLLVGVSGILIISNSIGITIVSRRGEIDVMRLVGATESFIRRPFYFEGILQGFVAGVVAFCVLYGIHIWLLGSVPELDVYLHIFGFRKEQFLSAGTYLGLIVPAGMILGLVGSSLALRRIAE